MAPGALGDEFVFSMKRDKLFHVANPSRVTSPTSLGRGEHRVHGGNRPVVVGFRAAVKHQRENRRNRDHDGQHRESSPPQPQRRLRTTRRMHLRTGSVGQRTGPAFPAEFRRPRTLENIHVLLAIDAPPPRKAVDHAAAFSPGRRARRARFSPEAQSSAAIFPVGPFVSRRVHRT